MGQAQASSSGGASGTGLLRKLISSGIAGVKKSPRAWYWSWRLAPYAKFLLPHEKDFFGLRHVPDPADGLLLDVGANTGISALGFRALGLRAPILSIEANALHTAALERVRGRIPDFDFKILAAGAEQSRITLHTPVYQGIPIHTMTSGELDFAKQNVERDFSPRIQRRMRYESHEVEVRPLDALELAPTTVKIDAEGLDYQVMIGLGKTIERYHPTLLVEYTPEGMMGALDFLSERGYRMFTYDHSRDLFTRFVVEGAAERWRESALQVNLFCVTEKVAAGLPGPA